MPRSLLLSSLLLSLLALAGCIPVASLPKADPYGGPHYPQPCPGTRWSSAVATYDLSVAPAVLPVEVEVAPGERVVAVSHRTNFSARPVEAVVEASADGTTWTAQSGDALTCWSSDTGNNGELTDAALDCVGLKQIRVGYVAPPGPALRYRVVLRAAGPGEKATGRAKVMVVPAACHALDACWRASGNNCDGAPLSNCDEDAAGMLRCPTSVGSEAHDSCCSGWGPTAYLCGLCGSTVSDRANLGPCRITDPPAGVERRLVSSASGDFPGGYIPCRAEWDLAFRDVAAVPGHLWSFDYDPLELTWRPTVVTRLKIVRGKPTAVPLDGAWLFPAGAQIRTLDAEQGWCASGKWSEVAAGTARCQ